MNHSDKVHQPALVITADAPNGGARTQVPPPPLPTLSTPTSIHAALLLPPVLGPCGGALPPFTFSSSASFSSKVLPPGDFPTDPMLVNHTGTSMGAAGDSPSSSLASSPTNMELGVSIASVAYASSSSTSSTTTTAPPHTSSFDFSPIPLGQSASAPPLTPHDPPSLTNIAMPSPVRVEFTPDTFSTSIRPVSPGVFGSGFVQPDPDHHHKRRISRRRLHMNAVGDSSSPFGTRGHDHAHRMHSFDSMMTEEFHPHSPLGGDSRRVSFSEVHAHGVASDHLQIPDFPVFDLSAPSNKHRRNSTSNPGNSESYSRNDSKSEGTSYAASGAMDTSSDDPTSTSRRTSGGRPSARDNVPSSASRNSSSRTQHLNGGTSHVGHTTPQTLNNGRGTSGSTSSHSHRTAHPSTRGGNSRYGGGSGSNSYAHAQSNGVSRRDSSKGMPPPPSDRDPAPAVGGASRSLSPKSRNGGVGPHTVIGSTTPAIPGMTARAQSMNGIANMSASSSGVTTRGQSSSSSTQQGTSAAQLPAEDTKRTPGGVASKKQKNRTRKRAAVACVSCHNAKTGCEGGIPCTRCVRLKKDHTCERFEHRKKGRPKKGRFEMMGYPSHLLGPDGFSNPMQMYFAQAQAAHAQAYGATNPYAQYAAASQMAAAGMSPGMSGSHLAAAAHAAVASGGMPSSSAAAAAQLSELRNSMDASPTPLMGTDPSMAAGILAPNGVTPLTPTGRGVTPPPPGSVASAKYSMIGHVDSKYSPPGTGTVAAPVASLLPGEQRRERFRNVFMACWARQMTAQKISLILENDIFHEAFRFALSFTALILSRSEYQVHESRVRRMCEDGGLSPKQITFPVQLYRFVYEVDQSAPVSNDALPACISGLRLCKPENNGIIRVCVSANKAMLETLQMSIHDVKDEVQQTGVPWHFALMHEEDWEQQVSLFLDAIQRLRFSSTMRLHHQSKSSTSPGATVTPALTTMSYEMVPPGVIGTVTACGIPYPSDMVMSLPGMSAAAGNSRGLPAMTTYSSVSSASSSISRSVSPMPLPGVVGMVNTAPPPMSKFTPIPHSATSHMNGMSMPVMPLPHRGGGVASPGMPIGATKMEQHA